jgi:hypothetical protein
MIPKSIDISILTFVRNGVSSIQNTIDSVVRQGQFLINCKYIIFDGNSFDGSQRILKENESKITTWILEPDKDIVDAQNMVIRMAKG